MSSFYSAESCHNVNGSTIDGSLDVYSANEAAPETTADRFAVAANRARIARDEARARARLQGKLAATFAALASLASEATGINGATTIGDLESIIDY